ncbi:MAG: TRAP transporter fused permease subunit [Bryobacterales bacterium]|nr:TRAP transporter fused permease subunit [Bryobacterales bacterium]
MALAGANSPVPNRDEPSHNTLRPVLCLGLGIGWIAFQVYVLFQPQAPLLERALHLTFAATILFLWFPARSERFGQLMRALDVLALGCALGVGAYYSLSARRLAERMEGVDPVLAVDMVVGILLVALLLEAVRRVVGWSLVAVLVAFLAYASVGQWAPGWLRFSGFGLKEAIEILSMSLNGILGITTATSVQFVFYFILFGAIYAAIGGGQLIIDAGLRLTGTRAGGAAQAAVVSSSLMGSITGSAVANVSGTGVFTIPLMRRGGHSREMAGAIEAVASTGGQLMPPVMGAAAFVMAEMLQVEYGRIALAALIPALAFYVAVFASVDLGARKSGIAASVAEHHHAQESIGKRAHLLIPPIVLVGMLVAGYSATYAAVIASLSCLIVCNFREQTRLSWRLVAGLAVNATRQASQVAVPIAAIGIIIAVAIQSNLALKFSSELMAASGGTALGAVGLIILGCLVMGMGLPTVAAYIIGAILFAPSLIRLGIPEMSAHFFVMYYCVLSMVTPPVALASYTAAGIAGGGTLRTSVYAFRLSLVSFLIPVALAFDPMLLGEGSLGWVAAAFVSLVAATLAWAAAVVGYWNGSLRVGERLWCGASGAAVVLAPTGTAHWLGSLAVLAAAWLWLVLRRGEQRGATSQVSAAHHSARPNRRRQ